MRKGRIPIPKAKQEQIKALRRKGLPYKEIAARCRVNLATVIKYSIGVQTPPFSRGYSQDGRSKDKQYQIEWRKIREDITDSLLFEFHDSFGLSEVNENDVKKFLSLLRTRSTGEREISYFLSAIEKHSHREKD